MSDVDLQELRGVFFEEAEEQLASIESTLLALETAPTDRALLDTAFRAAHSLKGTSGAFGFEDLHRFAQALEKLLQRLRVGTAVLDRALADLLLRSKDLLGGLLAAARWGGQAPGAMGDLLEELEWATPRLIDEGAVEPAYRAAVAAGGALFSSAPPRGDNAEGVVNWESRGSGEQSRRLM